MERDINDVTLQEAWGMVDEYNDIQSFFIKLLNKFNSENPKATHQSIDIYEPVRNIFTEDDRIYIEFDDMKYNILHIPFEWVDDPDEYWAKQKRNNAERWKLIYKTKIAALEKELKELNQKLKEVTDVQ